MSGQPSPSASKKAQPEPSVSGRYFLPARPLLWMKWMPACGGDIGELDVVHGGSVSAASVIAAG